MWHTRDTKVKGTCSQGTEVFVEQTSNRIIPILLKKRYDIVMHKKQKRKLKMCKERMAQHKGIN